MRSATSEENWPRAKVLCEEAQFLFRRLVGNPKLSEQQKTQFRAKPDDLQIVIDYLVNHKLRPARPSAKFDPKKSKILDNVLSTVAEVLEYLEQQSWEITYDRR